MPVSLEILQTSPFTTEDTGDLIKIYNADTALISTAVADVGKHSEQPIEQLQNLAGRDDWVIAAGRFNARLLCAMPIQQSDDTLHGHALCVREITRRRGVATQFIKLLQQYAMETDRQLKLYASDDRIATNLLEPLGFTKPGATMDAGSSIYLWANSH
ncbi:PanM family protein [bacterium]|nr:PanM family protein [bacterium]